MEARPEHGRVIDRRAVTLGLGALALAGPGRAQPPHVDVAPLLADDDRARLARLPFRHVSVFDIDAVAEWRRLRAAGGLYPVIVGDSGELRVLADRFGAARRRPARILAAAARLDLARDLPLLRAAQHSRDMEMALRHSDPGLGPHPQPEPPPLGIWPETPPAAAEPYAGRRTAAPVQPVSMVHILLLPARNGFETPAHLDWGGGKWNPPPEYHVAFFEKWHRDHGAEPVAITSDGASLYVPRPPETQVQALALAREQFLYCPANVYQGHGDLSAAAAALMQNWWHFWWE
jgi:hypothetical protein